MTAPAVRRLGPDDLDAMRGINALYAEAFEDPENYAAAPPDDAWLAAHLADRHVIALVAEDAGRVIGALTGYILPKLEQARSEIYIYDLAVEESHRRQGIATALIDALQTIGREASAWSSTSRPTMATSLRLRSTPNWASARM